MDTKIEICLENIESIIVAEESGANRVEFCSDLFEGGLTPTLGMFRVARKRCSIPMNVMIRPRGGDFCYSDVEFETMLENTKIFKEEGANAIVFGILDKSGEIDLERSQKIIEAARPLPVTFHRAIDMSNDAIRSMKNLIDLGVDRVLTSGLEPSVMEGLIMLKEMINYAKDDIIVMPGCGISERNFAYIKETLKAKEYHIYLPEVKDSQMIYRPNHIYMGGLLRQEEFLLSQTSSDRVKTIKGL
ncbi:MAG: copper homeostasis protein CutC [Spirochaetaceae bacterium]|nr:copper homeostasis protein CutC [Spirochaetaceae bacterium]